jgi:hypothetical protein
MSRADAISAAAMAVYLVSVQAGLMSDDVDRDDEGTTGDVRVTD